MIIVNDKNNYFKELNSVDVSKYVEKKNGLSYLSWSFCWTELKKRHPMSFYTIYENKDGINYFTDGKTCYVKTGVTVVIEGETLEHIEYLPVMDFRNKSIPLNAVTSFDVNKAIQRSLTKAVARHGLGLYIYAGEDLPETSAPIKEYKCSDCGKPFEQFTDKNGKVWNAGQVYHMSEKNNADGKARCRDCKNKNNK